MKEENYLSALQAAQQLVVRARERGDHSLVNTLEILMIGCRESMEISMAARHRYERRMLRDAQERERQNVKALTVF